MDQYFYAYKLFENFVKKIILSLNKNISTDDLQNSFAHSCKGPNNNKI